MRGKKFVLSAVKLVSALAGMGVVFSIWKKSVNKERQLHYTYKDYYELTNRWLKNRNRKTYIKDYLKQNDIKSIAIYGMGTLGELLFEELEGTDIKVAYFIDQNAGELYYVKKDIPMVGIDDINQQQRVDTIIITPISKFDTIADTLISKQVDLKMISLEEIIFNI